MNTIRLISIVLFFALFMPAFSQSTELLSETGKDTSLTRSDSVSTPEAVDSKKLTEQKPSCRVKLLAYFTKQLEEAYSELTTPNSQSAHLYNRARASIDAAGPLLRDDLKSFQAVSAFDICSVLTEAALVQISSQSDLQNADHLNGISDSLQFELYNLQNTINGLEKSYISNLEDKLAKTEQTLNQEREAAKKMMEEAQSRFSELQSEIINVSEDARGTIISMSDILFDVGKAGLTNDLKTNLAKIAGILLIYKNVSVVVEGHTDNAGSNEFNMKLSEQRATNVKDFLIEQGVPAERLGAVGYGFHRPVADNSTEEGRKKNRRVDLVIQDTRL